MSIQIEVKGLLKNSNRARQRRIRQQRHGVAGVSIRNSGSESAIQGVTNPGDGDGILVPVILVSNI